MSLNGNVNKFCNWLGNSLLDKLTVAERYKEVSDLTNKISIHIDA